MKLIKNIAIVASLATLSNAATITWTAANAPTAGPLNPDLTTANFVLPAGNTLASAVNWGGPATTFNGINFAAGTAAPGSFTAFDGFAPFYSNTSLTGTGIYSDPAAPFTLTGLIANYNYTVQVLVFDGRGGQTGRVASIDGSSTQSIANGTPGSSYGTGAMFTGTFKADSTTQNFTVNALTGPGGTSVGSQINAVVLSVPEPSAVLLGGVGALALLRRRRA